MARVIHVEIHGQQYSVRSDLDAQYIAELAGYLDERMRSAARELASADPLRIAIVAALNITDELYRARAESRGLEGHIQARTEAIERLVDAVLEDARARIAVNE
ncbi:MAG: cell division protein ZapA [Acidobacteriota bacterium]|jgi:cell division protein ZapA|nr:MAG: cell division protein ZapA [Acidobacteriota bacterium]